MPAPAKQVIETSGELRFQIDLQVPDAAIKTYLPQGWTSNVATSGGAKDCNVRLVFIDRQTVAGPDGKPLNGGSSRLAYLVAPVKDAQGNAAQLVLGGITDNPADVPGPFGNYLPAKSAKVQRTSFTDTAGKVTDTQDWAFTAASGEHLELHV